MTKRCRNWLCDEPIRVTVVINLCPACRRMARLGAEWVGISWPVYLFARWLEMVP